MEDLLLIKWKAPLNYLFNYVSRYLIKYFVNNPAFKYYEYAYLSTGSGLKKTGR